jgi:hypothetical protein
VYGRWVSSHRFWILAWDVRVHNGEDEMILFLLRLALGLLGFAALRYGLIWATWAETQRVKIVNVMFSVYVLFILCLLIRDIGR